MLFSVHFPFKVHESVLRNEMCSNTRENENIKHKSSKLICCVFIVAYIESYSLIS